MTPEPDSLIAHRRRGLLRPAGAAAWHRALLTVALIAAFALPALGQGGSRPRGRPAHRAAGAAVLSLRAVRATLPEMARQTAAGANRTALGHPTASRAITYASANGAQQVVISVDRYGSARAASAAYQEAVRGSEKVPGAKGAPVSGLGEKAFLGTVTQGGETHVGGGALFGARIVTVTLQGYNGTAGNRAKVMELIRKQADAGK